MISTGPFFFMLCEYSKLPKWLGLKLLLELSIYKFYNLLAKHGETPYIPNTIICTLSNLGQYLTHLSMEEGNLLALS